MVSWPQPGTRVTVRYRRPGGSVPPLTDAVGHLLDIEPLVRVQTKTGTVVQFAPADVVAVRVLSDAPVRTSQIRALEHAAALAWPGVEQQWLDGWLLRAGRGVTSRANSAVPLDISANSAAIPAIVDWYTQRGLTPRLAIADRLLQLPGVGEQANVVLVRDVSAAGPDPSVRLSTRPDFVSMFSHEFRTPLGVIQSSAEILEDYLEQLDPAERKDHLQSIRNNTRRMAGLMEEALLIGSLDAGKIEFKPAPIRLRAFLRKLVDDVLSATNHRCPIELSLVEMPDEIEADERLLQHIFTNLLANAIKYSDPGREVGFEIEPAGPEIVCTIRDQGIGIPKADTEWLFSPFHRGRNVHDRPGTGLGLVIVKRCVDLHGGTIQVLSKCGEGTVVSVRLPNERDPGSSR
jgi:signal transduction histidine kinase